MASTDILSAAPVGTAIRCPRKRGNSSKWREQFLAAGAERLQGRHERTEADELRRQIGRLERALGRKTLEVEVAGELLRGWE